MPWPVQVECLCTPSEIVLRDVAGNLQATFVFHFGSRRVTRHSVFDFGSFAFFSMK